MELPPLNDLKDLQLEDTKEYLKFREISGRNILPSMLISSIESLIIRNCCTFAFEVFYGVLLEIGDQLGIDMDELSKKALANFTYALQTKKLSVFRELQQSKDFSTLVNNIGELFYYENDKKTARAVKNLLRNLNVGTLVHNSIIVEHKPNDKAYTTLNLLTFKKKLFLLYEKKDFMDDEAIKLEEEEERKKLEELEKLRLAEEARLAKLHKEEEDRKKNRRIYEETLKKIEAQKLAERQRLEKDKELRRQQSLIEKQKKTEEEAERRRLAELNRKLKEEEEKRLKDEQEKILEQKRQEQEELERLQNLKKEEERKEEERKEEERKEQEEERLKQEEILRQEQEEEERKLREEAFSHDICSSLSIDSPVFIDPELVEEVKFLESMSPLCGSFFCMNCFRMLKRSSLFLKCKSCCDKAFLEPFTRSSIYNRPSIPKGSICVGCNKGITKGEVIQCICCYVKTEFFKVSQTNCSDCCNTESVGWIDTHAGNKYEMVKCNFCERNVNYMYVVEVCKSCHDQICLYCLRKNSFIAISVCSECHSRRELNPFKPKIKPKRPLKV
ncbi:hypothetical protein SteCoe_32079 [Stentor coeruleus]|uniref:Uncharacterized protein n=1 Tax=Stentor coeruleus TaxID=5963 RepID=A0A1R2AZU6_9CILI|nr:hypothetical protein SteCoe_32079 [Stentor coeruleus]